MWIFIDKSLSEWNCANRKSDSWKTENSFSIEKILFRLFFLCVIALRQGKLMMSKSWNYYQSISMMRFFAFSLTSPCLCAAQESFEWKIIQWQKSVYKNNWHIIHLFCGIRSNPIEKKNQQFLLFCFRAIFFFFLVDAGDVMCVRFELNDSQHQTMSLFEISLGHQFVEHLMPTN